MKTSILWLSVLFLLCIIIIAIKAKIAKIAIIITITVINQNQSPSPFKNLDTGLNQSCFNVRLMCYYFYLAVQKLVNVFCLNLTANETKPCSWLKSVLWIALSRKNNFQIKIDGFNFVTFQKLFYVNTDCRFNTP